MSRYKTIYKEIEIDVDLADFTDDDIMEEAAERGLASASHGTGADLIDKIFNARRLGQPYDHLLDEYLYILTGRAI